MLKIELKSEIVTPDKPGGISKLRIPGDKIFVENTKHLDRIGVKYEILEKDAKIPEEKKPEEKPKEEADKTKTK